MKTEGKWEKGSIGPPVHFGGSVPATVFLAHITMSFQRDKAHHDHGPITQLAQQLHTDSARDVDSRWAEARQAGRGSDEIAPGPADEL